MSVYGYRNPHEKDHFTDCNRLLASNAMAMSRHDSQSLTCAQVHDKVAQEGSVVLRYPSHHDQSLAMYSRAVSNSMTCIGQGSMASESVPTSDNPNCKIKTCSTSTGKGPNKNHH
jgi:hypothetical protein